LFDGAATAHHTQKLPTKMRIKKWHSKGWEKKLEWLFFDVFQRSKVENFSQTQSKGKSYFLKSFTSENS
jgi:hypothetical protein